MISLDCSSLTSLPRAPGHMVALPKCSVLSTMNTCLFVTTLPPLSAAVTTMTCLPWARLAALNLALEAGPVRSRCSPSRTNLTVGTPSWSVALTRTEMPAFFMVLSSEVTLSTGGRASTKTWSSLVVALPARSAVVIATSDAPSGSLALTAYLPEESAVPLALIAPSTTVTVA